MRIVVISNNAKKELRKLPFYIIESLYAWIEDVGKLGLMEVRRTSGYHDEPLKGSRMGQRSIKLNRSYRAIYEIKSDGFIEFISIEEVNKHDY